MKLYGLGKALLYKGFTKTLETLQNTSHICRKKDQNVCGLSMYVCMKAIEALQSPTSIGALANPPLYRDFTKTLGTL